MRLMPFGLPITRAYAAYLCRDRHHAALRPGVAVTRERPCLCSLTAHSPGPRILVAVHPHLLARSRARLRTTWRESSGLPEPPGERVLPGLFADAESLAEGEDAPGAGRSSFTLSGRRNPGTARPSCRVRLDLGPAFPSEPAPASASGRVPGAQPPVAGVAFGGPPAVARPGPSACDVGTRAAPHRGVTTGPGSPPSSTRTLRRGCPNLPDHIPLPQSPGLASDTLGCQATSPSPTRSTNESEKGLGWT